MNTPIFSFDCNVTVLGLTSSEDLLTMMNLLLLYVTLLFLDRWRTILGLSFNRWTKLTGEALSYSRRIVSTTALQEKSSNSDNYFSRPGPWDERDLNSLLDANKAW